MKQINENLYKLNKRQCLQKTKLGEWRVINPIKDPETNEFIWFNFIIGTWSRFITVIVIVSLICFMAWGYKHDNETCRNLVYNRTFFEEKCLDSMIKTEGDINDKFKIHLLVPPEDIDKALNK